MPATAHLTRHAGKMKQVANLSRMGGHLLVGVGVAASCVQIANEENIKEKNEIFVETLTSTAFGYMSGALIGAYLVTNPLGWGTVIVLAVGSTASGLALGKVTAKVYSELFGDIDLVGGIGVDKVCR